MTTNPTTQLGTHELVYPIYVGKDKKLGLFKAQDGTYFVRHHKSPKPLASGANRTQVAAAAVKRYKAAIARRLATAATQLTLGI